MTGLVLVLLAALADGGAEPVEIQTPAARLVAGTTAREYIEQLLNEVLFIEHAA